MGICQLITLLKNYKMNKKRKTGFLKSKLDGNELIFSFGGNTELPSEYTYKPTLPKPLNQGDDPICVPCSLSTYINWKLNLQDGSKKDNHINIKQIFQINQNNNEGMTFKEALAYLKFNGVSYDNGNFIIKQYGMVKSLFALKYAVVMNGPCFGALPVYRWGEDFWIKRNGDSLLGYHAIAIVGYNKDGFIIRNSWGESFGNKGYAILKYDDFKKFVEIWTVIR